MICPACGAPLVSGQARCVGCGTMVGPPVEGALAPDPASLRDVPSLRRREREKTWKDEVRERVRHRKHEKSKDRELPLFKDEVVGSEPPPEPEPPMEPATNPVPEMALGEPPDESHGADPYALTEKMSEADPDIDDLPLNVAPPFDTQVGRLPREPEPVRRSASTPDDEREKWPQGAHGERQEPPVERPAFASERARAAAVDLLFLATLWAVVVYFAGRAAHVATAQLLQTWPWLLGYLAFLGLAYAAYFTGTTGQTLGKILGNLRVVNTAGRPPGYLRSLTRAGLGALGVLLAGLGIVPMFLDPARRGLHDKLLGTRVVRQ